MSIVLAPLHDDAFDHIEEGFTVHFIRALARHAPLESLRFVARGKFVEVLRDGTFRAPSVPEGASSLEEWPGVGHYVSWPFGEPEGGRRIPDLAALILPGVGWELAKLREDPHVARWIAHGPCAAVRIGLLEDEVDMYDAARSGGEGDDLLNAAMYQSLILCFG